MPTKILRPTSAPATGGWTFASGAFVANISDANDGTRIYNTDANDEFVVEYQDLVLPARVVAVTSHFRHSRSGGGIEIAQFVKLAGVYTYGAWIAPGSIAQTNEVLACPTGAWTRGKVNSLQGGCVSRTGSPTEEGYVYDLWLSVLLQGGAAAFADIMGSLFAGATIPAMAWQSMASVRREIVRAHGLWIHDDEVRDASAALRHHPHRRVFCSSPAPTLPLT